MSDKCRACGGRAELAVASETGRQSALWLCKRCALRLAPQVSGKLAAQIAADEPSLRIRTGVQIEPGDVLLGASRRYRAVVRITGLGRDEEHVGVWTTNEAEADAAAVELGKHTREIITRRAREVGNN